MPTPSRKRAMVVVYLRTGSRFESAEENGLSHFLEHMLFRGTNAHPSAHRLATAFESLGGTLDATTAADHGTLGIDVPAENLFRVLPLLAEVMKRPLLEEIDIERGIIREELLEDLGDDGQLVNPPTLMRRLAFGRSGLGQPITGPLSNVERFTTSELRAHHERTYIANHSVVSVAGPFEADAVHRAVCDAFGDLRVGAPLAVSPPAAQGAPLFSFAKHGGSSQTSVLLGYRCLGSRMPGEAAVDMLMRVIDDGMATRLYHELCDKRGLCYSVTGGYETYEDVGLVELEADTAHERAPQVLGHMLELTHELACTRISDEEFERLQKRARWQYEAYLDEPGAAAEFFALAACGKTAETPGARLEELLSVTKEDIRDAAASTFAPSGRSVVCVGSAKRAALESLALG